MQPMCKFYLQIDDETSTSASMGHGNTALDPLQHSRPPDHPSGADLEVCSWRRSSLSQVVSICDLQRLALYWHHAPGLQLDNEVSQSTNQPHGTVCHQHSVTGPVGERRQAGTEDAPVLDRPAPLRRLHHSGARYKYPDLLNPFRVSQSDRSICYEKWMETVQHTNVPTAAVYSTSCITVITRGHCILKV